MSAHPSDPATRDVLAFLAAERGVDLTDHRPEVIAARLSTRLSARGYRDVAGYLGALRSDPIEMDRLLAVLLVNVTSFFRDPDVFATLRTSVLPALVADTRPHETVRAWSVGTATGEEAWTLAMVLAEAVRARTDLAWEVMATDLDQEALDTAGHGRYPAASASAIPPGLREAFLEVGDGDVRVGPHLRAGVRFLGHDLVGPRLAPAEAVVASFDLVLCRNMLIYFNDHLKEKAGERLAVAVRPGGVLVLGRPESLPASVGAGFEPVSEPLRIYRRREPAGMRS